MKRRALLIHFCKVVFLNILIFYLLAESILGWLRLPREYKKPVKTHQFQPVLDSGILYINKPNTKIGIHYDGNPRGYFRKDNIVDHRTNRHGFRGPDFVIPPPEDVFRIVFLGDSVTFGEGVYERDVYPQKFFQMGFREKLFYPKKIEVINLGVGGYNTQQEWALLQREGTQLSPDMIILGYSLNDPEPPLFQWNHRGMMRRNREQDVQGKIPRLGEAPWPVRISHVHQLIWLYRQKQKITQLTISYYRSLYDEASPNWQKTQTALSALRDYAVSRDIPLVVVIFPVLYQVNDRYPLQDVHRKLHELLQQLHVPYIDLLTRLKGYQDLELWVHPSDSHPNEIVHQIAAEALLEKLRQTGTQSVSFGRFLSE